MTSAALIFTRSDSVRLPQKFRAKIGGLPLIELIVRRATQLSCDIIIVATSDRSIDDEIEDIVKALAPKLSKKVYCLRGAFEDVVLRTRQGEAQKHHSIHQLEKKDLNTHLVGRCQLNHG